MITSFESVYKELENLFINKLPEYIEKINKEHNDGIILKPFVNTRLDEECIKLPCFKFNLEESEYTEKDRIIENTIFTIGLDIKLAHNSELDIVLFCRYVESIMKMFFEENKLICQYIKITKIHKQKIFIKYEI